MEKLNAYRFKKFNNKYAVTTDQGTLTILTEKEFSSLQSRKITNKLKQKLKKGSILVDDSNMGRAVAATAKKYSFLFKGASLHIIVATLRCNMNCIYCQTSSKHTNKKGFDMGKDTARRTVDFIFQSPNNNITIEFQGGEPLLNWPIVKYIIEYAENKNKAGKKNLLLTIVTNMTEMDTKKMDYLIFHKVNVCTSLDGPKKLHDLNRPFAETSNYGIVAKWIRRFQQEYKKRGIKDRQINAIPTLTRQSLRYPKEIVDEYVRLGLNNIHLRFLHNLGVARKTWPKISYSPDSYLDFWKKAVQHISRLRKKGIDIKERIVSIILDKINNDTDPGYLDLRSPCGAAIGQLLYNYDGSIYSCDEARMIGEDIFMLGRVSTHSYRDVLSSHKALSIVNASINDQYICDSCIYKPYCGICPVCNYAENNNIIPKISESSTCKIYKAQFDHVLKENFIY
ncbi:His-Xaa-Ser system radical SAM maturase HxsB [Candidatus Woesearchaeota archaeon]|nr:His-Xaa-Ser system radical SAM maturase HxsB [Candidatus Woesearchaeota archaeon]